MNVEGYLQIAGRRLGSHVATHGANLSQEDCEQLWSQVLEEFFASEPVSDEARRAFSALSLEKRTAFFARSIFSLQRFSTLAREAIEANQH